MSTCKLHCGHVHGDRLLRHSCLVRRPQTLCLRLKHYHIATRRPLRTFAATRASSQDEPHRRAQPHAKGSTRHAFQHNSWSAAQDATDKLSLGQHLLRFCKQIGLAAIFLVFGFGRVLSARARSAQNAIYNPHAVTCIPNVITKLTFASCSVPRTPDPAPLVYTAARHGETVSTEASISGSSEHHRCQDTGIQLAAATETGEMQSLG